MSIYLNNMNMSAIDIKKTLNGKKFKSGLKWIPVNTDVSTNVNINDITSFKYKDEIQPDDNPLDILNNQLYILSNNESELTKAYYYYIQLLSEIDHTKLTSKDRKTLKDIQKYTKNL